MEALLDLFGGGAPRVVALLVNRGYRDVGAQTRAVQFRSREACVHCAQDGCPVCEWVGWTVGTHSIEIVVPAGAEVGTHLRVPAHGTPSVLAVLERPAELMLEIVEAGARAELLADAQTTFEDGLLARWGIERAARARERALQRRLAIALLVVIAAGVLATVLFR